jgi:hypothetical protein
MCKVDSSDSGHVQWLDLVTTAMSLPVHKRREFLDQMNNDQLLKTILLRSVSYLATVLVAQHVFP